jgi:hypothetical protein
MGINSAFAEDLNGGRRNWKEVDKWINWIRGQLTGIVAHECPSGPQ